MRSTFFNLKFLCRIGVIITLGCCQTAALSAQNPDIRPGVFKVDTIIFKQITFKSDLEVIAEKCIKGYTRTEPLTKLKVLKTRELLNKELKTKVFNSLETVTGTSVRLDGSQWAMIMEWHFNSDEPIENIERALNKLKNGKIRHTINPIACKWVHGHNKLYFIQYTLRSDNNDAVEEIYKCIVENKN